MSGPQDEERDGLWARRPPEERVWARPEAPSSFGPPDDPPAPGSGSSPSWPAPPRRTPPASGRPRPEHGGAVLERFEPLDRRARLARAALWTVVAVAVLVVASDLAELALLERARDGDFPSVAEADSNDERQALVALVQLAAYVFAGVAFVRWFNLAYRGLDALGARRRFHTGWSIGAWFVPILNLWRPLQVANDLWDAGEGDEPRGILGAWWAAFVVASLLGNVVARLVFDQDDSLEDLIRLDRVDIAASVVDVVGVLLAIAVVTRITARLHRRAGIDPR